MSINPYHFVPVNPTRHQLDLEKGDFVDGKTHVTHDRYVSDTHSGRLICRITTQSPIFVGGKKILEATVERPAEYTHFSLPDNKLSEPAIPGSSLRGVISSVAESLANSSMRVLSDEMYSYRKAASKDALSAIGMIKIEINDKETKYKLQPLTLPTLNVDGHDVIQISDPTLKQLYRTPNLKVFIGDRDSIRNDNFYRTYRHDDQEFFWMELLDRSWNRNNGIDFDHNLHCKYKKNIRRNGGFVLGQKPLNPTIWTSLPENQDGTQRPVNAKFTRGIIRVLGCWGERESSIPNTKYHEIFIPYPEREVDSWPLYDISPEAIERFYDLADQRTNEEKDHLLPYEPKDTIRNLNSNDRKFRLKEGDLVFFKNQGSKIIEISLSSVWRGRVEKIINNKITKATTHDFFRYVNAKPNELNEELLPFNSNRQYVTLAEQIFGFVQQDKHKNEQKVTAEFIKTDDFLSLAGRVWFSHAKMHRTEGDTPYLSYVTLKILDSPKPPCPSMYFVEKNTRTPRFIAKKDLNPKTHRPQGRKYYLHHESAIRDNNSDKPWRSRFQWDEERPLNDDHSFKQQTRIAPVKSKTVFYFHIDFENLSSVDLGLLLYALEPSPRFRHKIGMGKSIGLGSVKIETVGFYRIDRAIRYKYDGLFKPRYSRLWAKDLDDWPDAYKNLPAAESVDKPDDLRKEFLESIKSDHQDILKALELIGDKDYQDVQTPVTAGSTPEIETFKWFVINDRGTEEGPTRTPVEQQFLRPLDQNSTAIKELVVHPMPVVSDENNRNR